MNHKELENRMGTSIKDMPNNRNETSRDTGEKNPMKWLMFLFAILAMNLFSGCSTMNAQEQVHTFNYSFPEGAMRRHF
jgi:hypothetical protein